MRRMGLPVWLCMLLGAAVLLLLFSALIEAPMDATEPIEPIEGAISVCFAPALLPPADSGQAPVLPQALVRLALLLGGALLLPFLLGCRDSNGRVIRHKRYTDSVYPVFRVESAAG